MLVTSKSWPTTSLIILPSFLAALICFTPDGVHGAVPSNSSLAEKYICTFPGGATIVCYGSQDYYACCYEPYGEVMHKCGLDCYGLITYQRPSTTPLSTTHFEEATLWERDEASGGVKLSVTLMISIPVAAVVITILGVSITWCVALYKRRNTEPQNRIELNFGNSRPNDDIENALNESRQLNEAPPNYHEAVNEQASLFGAGEVSSQQCTPPPPSYTAASRY